MVVVVEAFVGKRRVWKELVKVTVHGPGRAGEASERASGNDDSSGSGSGR
jgi:hypothetical protein